LKKVTEDGIKFSSPIDGQKVNLTPELSIQIQEELGVDIAMVLDHLSPGTAQEKEQEFAVNQTAKWAERCKNSLKNKEMSLFGIVQGGTFKRLSGANQL